MRALAWKLVEVAFACAATSACGDDGGGGGGGTDADSSSSSAGEDTPDPDTESTGGEGPIATGTCTAWSTTGSKADVFIPDGAPTSDTCAEAVAACGGDPHGTWTLDASCGHDLAPLANPFTQTCPGASFSAGMPTRAGTLTVDEVGHFTMHVATTHSFTFGAAVDECFGTFNCDASVVTVLTQAAGGGTGTCTGDAFSCNCSIEGIEKDAVTAEGQLRGGDALSLVSDSAAYPYCVGDGRLEVWSLGGVAMPTSTACATDDDCSDIAPGTIGACLPK